MPVSWGLTILVGNDGIITLSRCNNMGLSSNSKKRCDVGWHFLFCISESHDGGVLYAHDTWLLIFFCINLQYLQCNQLQTLFLLIPTDEKFFPNLWKQNMKVQKTLVGSSVKKHQKMFWHQRFATQIQKSCIANALGWIPFVFLWSWEIFISSFFHFSINIDLKKINSW